MPPPVGSLYALDYGVHPGVNAVVPCVPLPVLRQAEGFVIPVNTNSNEDRL